jgi:hypothetical protein
MPVNLNGENKKTHPYLVYIGKNTYNTGSPNKMNCELGYPRSLANRK